MDNGPPCLSLQCVVSKLCHLQLKFITFISSYTDRFSFSCVQFVEDTRIDMTVISFSRNSLSKFHAEIFLNSKNLQIIVKDFIHSATPTTFVPVSFLRL